MSRSPLVLDPVVAWRRLAVQHRPLAVSALATVGLLALFLLGLVLDPRTIGGAPAWLKPAKFGVSIAVYSFTLLWLLGHLRRDRRWRDWTVRIAGWTVVVVFAIELLAIGLQAARGTTSHFNYATPFDAALFVLMGNAITVLLVVNVAVAALVLSQRFGSPSLGAGLRWGMAITVLGMAQAFLMVMPTAQQLAGWQAGGDVTIIGAHSVGAPDGLAADGATPAAAMPVTGWRTDVGDLRVGHFVGLHGLQVIPLLAAWLQRRRLRELQRSALVHVAGGGYLGLTLLLTWQALRAQPLLRPDALTVGTFVALVAACALATWVVLRRVPPAAEGAAGAADGTAGAAASAGAGARVGV